MHSEAEKTDVSLSCHFTQQEAVKMLKQNTHKLAQNQWIQSYHGMYCTKEDRNGARHKISCHSPLQHVAWRQI